MKKISIIIFSILLLFSGVVSAQSLETKERTEENRYGIPKRFETGEKQIYRALMTPYIDETLKVYDFTPLLSVEEEQELREDIQNKFSKEDYEVVIVTIPDLDSRSPREYAEDFYDYNHFNPNGILLLISLESRDVYIVTSGYGQILFDQSRTEAMIEKITPSLSSGRYFDAMKLFLNEVESFTEKGPAKAMKSCKIINSYGDYRCKKQVPIFWIVPISFLISFVVTYLCARKYKKILLADDADTYLEKEKLKLGGKIDSFMYSSTSRVRLSTSTSGSGGSHHGSSGASHGGSGGKF